MGRVAIFNKVSRKDTFPEKRYLTETQGWRRSELCRDQGRALQLREGKSWSGQDLLCWGNREKCEKEETGDKMGEVMGAWRLWLSWESWVGVKQMVFTSYKGCDMRGRGCFSPVEQPLPSAGPFRDSALPSPHALLYPSPVVAPVEVSGSWWLP